MPTITHYYDGPRGGVADYAGKPHLYASLFDDAADDWSGMFLLMPIEEEVFVLALEDWRIWRRWETAYRVGKTSLEAPCTLPEDRARREELKRLIGTRLEVIPALAIKARGEFRDGVQETDAYGLEVRWTPLSE